MLLWVLIYYLMQKTSTLLTTHSHADYSWEIPMFKKDKIDTSLVGYEYSMSLSYFFLACYLLHWILSGLQNFLVRIYFIIYWVSWNLFSCQSLDFLVRPKSINYSYGLDRSPFFWNSTFNLCCYFFLCTFHFSHAIKLCR